MTYKIVKDLPFEPSGREVNIVNNLNSLDFRIEWMENNNTLCSYLWPISYGDPATSGFFEEIKPVRWRAKKGGKYWIVGEDFFHFQSTDAGWTSDNIRYELGNYFETEELATAAAKAIKKLLKEINP